MKTRKFFKFFLIFTILESLVSCQSPKTVYVPVYTIDSTANSHKEKETIHDTTIIEKTTIIREADSALLAQLKAMGIKVSDYERMLVIMQHQLTSQIRNQQMQNSDTATHIREVEKPVPVYVEVEVEKPLSWWEKTFMWAGVIGIVAFLVWVVLKLKPIKK